MYVMFMSDGKGDLYDQHSMGWVLNVLDVNNAETSPEHAPKLPSILSPLSPTVLVD